MWLINRILCWLFGHRIDTVHFEAEDGCIDWGQDPVFQCGRCRKFIDL